MVPCQLSFPTLSSSSAMLSRKFSLLILLLEYLGYCKNLWSGSEQIESSKLTVSCKPIYSFVEKWQTHWTFDISEMIIQKMEKIWIFPLSTLVSTFSSSIHRKIFTLLIVRPEYVNFRKSFCSWTGLMRILSSPSFSLFHNSKHGTISSLVPTIEVRVLSSIPNNFLTQWKTFWIITISTHMQKQLHEYAKVRRFLTPCNSRSFTFG